MASYYGNDASFRHRRSEQDVDPLSSVANLSDAMLVFACGLLVALVVAYNVSIDATPAQVELDPSQEIPEDVQQLQDPNSAGSSYVERGRVYEDPNTGKLYLLEEQEGSQDQDASRGQSLEGQQ